MSEINRNVLEEFFNSKNIIVLTGAGISAESGLPTFRGKDGFWVKDGQNYSPMELATYESFSKQPELVWEWYHYRRNLYSKTKPNPGHFALAKLEKFFELNNRSFHLVTQNVDGLHFKAGSSGRLLEIHGNIYYMRCFDECSDELVLIPENTTGVPTCAHCGGSMRPHVLWLDEFYEEQYYKFRTVLELGDSMDALLMVGTTLQTNVPRRLFELSYIKQLPTIEINPNPLGLTKYGVLELKGKSGEILPEIVAKVSKSTLNQEID